MLAGVLLAYILGAAAGLFIMERSLRDQWTRAAEVNAQIVSAVIRHTYTFVAVDADEHGQITGILSERLLGDSTAVLDTGFSTADVLAQAASQTKSNAWLFQREPGRQRLVGVADAWGTLGSHPDGQPPLLQLAAPQQFYTGFAHIGDEEHFIASLPVLAPDGQLLGSVVSSIGLRSELYATHNDLVHRSLLVLLTVLAVTLGGLFLLKRRVFRPVPRLIEALTRIAHNDTRTTTPFLERDDEIGDLACAIEKLRTAVIEREHLLEIKERALRLEYMAHHDVLTGLPNRAQLNNTLDHATEKLAVQQRFNLMLFDLDDFKVVNDRFGHATGDKLLVEIGERISLLLGSNDTAARLGGDEFAIIQQIARDAEQEAQRLATRLIEAISRPIESNGLTLSVGVSIGIARAPNDGHTPHELLLRADVALYAAKNDGRRRFMFYRHGMSMPAQHETTDG